MKSAKDIDDMSVRELKAFIASRGGSTSGCIEKCDLKRRARELEGVTPSKAVKLRSYPYGTLERDIFGGIECLAVKGTAPPTSINIIMHGYGADNNDLLPFGHEMLKGGSRPGQWWVFPNAIRRQPTGGREWWPLDLDQLLAKFMSGTLTEEVPPGLSEARAAVLLMLDDICEQTGLSYDRIILGGFSQGAMLATDIALRLKGNLKGLVIFSGLLICESEWRELVSNRKGLRVLQSHGTKDPLLAYPLALRLKGMLEEGGAIVDFISFEGVHTIPAEAVGALAEFTK